MKTFKIKGFTLVELIATLAIVGLLLSYGAPSLSKLVEDNKADANIRSFLNIFSLARSRAVLSSQIVTICPSNDFISCTNDWQLPIIVFTDKDNNKAITGTDKLIHSYPHQQYEIDIEVHPTHKQYFQYSATGLSHGTPGNIVFCPKSRNMSHARQVVISFSGRVRVSIDSDHDGLVEDAYGSVLSCS